MMGPSWLDAIVHRFQHNWETNPQYRAVISGVIGLVIVIGLCVTMGAAAVFASNVGGSLGGGGGSNNFIGQSGPNAQATDVTFPMLTLTPWPSPQYPGAAPIPASGTPQPSPTAAPTATPAPTDTPCVGQGCGGGGGGGGGGSVTITSVSPVVIHNGTKVSVSVHTTTPNDGVSFNIRFPNGGGYYPDAIPGAQTDGSGNGTFLLPAAAGCPGGIFIWIKTQFDGQVSTTVPCVA